MKTLQIPSKLQRAVRWLLATIDGECGPDHPEFPVPLRHLIIKGGRGSGKSHSVARIFSNVLKVRPVRALCTRETQKSIEESVYTLLDDVIQELGFGDFYTTKKTSIDGANGSQFLFAGLRSNDINKLKSTERIKLCWVEEAHAISARSIQVLTPTIRADNSVIVWTYNPELEDDPVHREFALNPQADTCVVEMNWRDNPWFPKVLDGERLRARENDKTPDQHIYNWIWEGQCLPAVEGAIFANEVGRFQERGRVLKLDHDPRGKVFGVMDLGWGVMTMALWQRFASTMQCIDYYEVVHWTYSDLSDRVRKDHPKARWGPIFMPHDASHKDPKTGKSHFRVMEELGWQTAKIEQIGVENYINAGRSLFETAYISDNENCARLLQCLKRYRRQLPSTTEHPAGPMKDEFSHGGETWCYSAVCAEEMVNEDYMPDDPYKELRDYAIG